MSRLTLVIAAVIAVTTAAPANAVTHDKLAYLTFSTPVQIPGATLSAGTYRFHLTNPDTSRNVLQVLSGDGVRVYAMFHTIPDSRAVPTEEPTVTFRETPAGVPPAVRTLFYGGEYRGYEFIYPKERPVMTVEEWPQPEITYSALPAARGTAPFLEDEPMELFGLGPEPVIEPAVEAVPRESQELPRTASPLPLLATGGLASIFAGLALGLLRRHVT